ncbi:MAG: alpha/beta hydrolase, partial [Nocardioidaceae bacterium]|nr:alpha/beta hydrolase [Nocardioidaceae bacterium]
PYGQQSPLSRVPSNAIEAGHQRGVAFSPSFQGVACSDTVNPNNPRRWIDAGAFADRKGPWFGRLWTWLSVDCARWPGSDADAFRGPWKVQTDNPLLIVSTLHDPATPITGARSMHRQFVDSSLIVTKTWGHGSLGTSECIERRYSDYLVSGNLPPSGLVCLPDKSLFPVPVRR